MSLLQRMPFTASSWVLLFATGACSQGGHGTNAPQFFYGECRLNIDASRSEHSMITVDGVEVGHEKVELEVPCGEKRVLVEKKGFIPFYHFVQVNKHQPVLLKIELEKLKHLENEALSARFIEKVKADQLVIAKAAAGAGGAGGGTAGAAASGGAEWDNVEAWR